MLCNGQQQSQSAYTNPPCDEAFEVIGRCQNAKSMLNSRKFISGSFFNPC